MRLEGKPPAEKAKELGVPLVQPGQPTGVCAKCGRTLYNNQKCTCEKPASKRLE